MALDEIITAPVFAVERGYQEHACFHAAAWIATACGSVARIDYEEVIFISETWDLLRWNGLRQNLSVVHAVASGCELIIPVDVSADLVHHRAGLRPFENQPNQERD